ncbi:hypothetical protein R6Q59_027062 [Mikania micrantha]
MTNFDVKTKIKILDLSTVVDYPYSYRIFTTRGSQVPRHSALRRPQPLPVRPFLVIQPQSRSRFISTGRYIMGWKAAQKLIHHWKILRGDNVMIIRGKDRGETGTIKRVIRSQNRVIVEGKNLVKKHIKQGQGHEGGIFTVEAPLHVSNVQIIDPVTGQPCKVGIRYQEDGTKVRVSRGIGASGSIIPRPEILKIRATPRPTIAGPKDTPLELVQEKTYNAKTGMGMPDL